MSKRKAFETELPVGYKAAYTLDALHKKTALVLNLVALVLMALVLLLSWLVIQPTDFENGFRFRYLAASLIGMLLYMVLHELVHGAAYKLLTGCKLRFGLSASCAYCGVPDIYVYRHTALIALLAPFVLFSILLLIFAGIVPNPWAKLSIMLVFAVHFGGCSGDLYDTYLYLFRFRDSSTLMRDTGPKQTFYTR